MLLQNLRRHGHAGDLCMDGVGRTLCPSFAEAEVVRVEMASVAPWLGGRSYEKLQGRVYFELDPESSTGRRVTDITLAPRNARGRVGHLERFCSGTAA